MRTSILVITCLVSLYSGAGLAQSKVHPPGFEMTRPVLNKVVVENEYQFLVREYTPPVQVKVVRREDASYASPEMSAIAGISAMVGRDFGWFRSTWDQASQTAMAERDAQMNQDAAFWIRSWERTFANRHVELTTRIETGDYVLIAYRVVSETEKPVELVAAFKSVNGSWLATQELSQDPVLLYWKTPDVRPRRVVRQASLAR